MRVAAREEITTDHLRRCFCRPRLREERKDTCPWRRDRRRDGLSPSERSQLRREAPVACRRRRRPVHAGGGPGPAGGAADPSTPAEAQALQEAAWGPWYSTRHVTGGERAALALAGQV